jgi:demethylspheroidene O-methyltransferase
MAEFAPAMPPAWPRWSWRGWRNRRAADRAFQAWAAGFPLTRGLARREGERLFDLVAGFVHTQILLAVVELDLLARCRDAPVAPAALAARSGVPAERMAALLRGAAALGLFERVGEGFQTSRLGAAALGVPGLQAMIRHHPVLYRDLADPVAFLKGRVETELAGFWPYVFGAAGAADPEVAATYSGLMAETQGLVAEETLRMVSLKGVRRLMDVGGGTGAFLAAAGRAVPALELVLFDLPAVVAGARERLAHAGLTDRSEIVAGSFRDDPLPGGADAISLVRVLYDHGDDTVAALLAKVFAALPPGGRVIVAEPMSGGARPERAGDAYFAFYCMAMRTGRVRSAEAIAAMLSAAGFAEVRTPRPRRPFVASAVVARKPG